jgi:hypothetical protein
MSNPLSIDKRKSKSDHETFSPPTTSPKIQKTNSMPSLNSENRKNSLLKHVLRPIGEFSPPSPSKDDLNSFITKRRSGLSEEFLELEKIRKEMLEVETISLSSEEKKEE